MMQVYPRAIPAWPSFYPLIDEDAPTAEELENIVEGLRSGQCDFDAPPRAWTHSSAVSRSGYFTKRTDRPHLAFGGACDLAAKETKTQRAAKKMLETRARRERERADVQRIKADYQRLRKEQHDRRARLAFGPEVQFQIVGASGFEEAQACLSEMRPLICRFCSEIRLDCRSIEVCRIGTNGYVVLDLQGGGFADLTIVSDRSALWHNKGNA